MYASPMPCKLHSPKSQRCITVVTCCEPARRMQILRMISPYRPKSVYGSTGSLTIRRLSTYRQFLMAPTYWHHFYGKELSYHLYLAKGFLQLLRPAGRRREYAHRSRAWAIGAMSYFVGLIMEGFSHDRSSEHLIPVPKDTHLTQTHTKTALNMPEEVRPMLPTYPDNSVRGKNWGEARLGCLYIYDSLYRT